MKQFLREVSQEWQPLRHFPRYRYSIGTARYFIRRVIIALNKEASAVTLHLFHNPLSVAVLAGAIYSSATVPYIIGKDDIVSFLNIISGFIVSFISVLVAAAIFISTLHRQSNNKSAEEDVKFLTQINNNKNTLMTVYEICQDIASNEQKVKLFKATPCDSVLEYVDYEPYKQWHQKHIASLDNVRIESYDSYLRYPYNTAMSVSWNRSYFMADGCVIALALLNQKPEAERSVKNAVKHLLVAAKRNQTAGSRGYYIPVEFVGQRLNRVVVYSLFALICILATIMFNDYALDLLPSADVDLAGKFLVAAVVTTALSLYLILRYVFKFIGYLKDSTAYSSSSFNSLYVYEPDMTMHDPGNSYGI